MSNIENCAMRYVVNVVELIETNNPVQYSHTKANVLRMITQLIQDLDLNERLMVALDRIDKTKLKHNNCKFRLVLLSLKSNGAADQNIRLLWFLSISDKISSGKMI